MLRKRYLLWMALLAFCFILFFSAPPTKFPTGDIFEIKSGESMGAIGQKLRSENYVQSSYFFRAFALLFGANIKAGSYEFDTPVTAFEVAFRMSRGDYRIRPVKIVVHEGTTIAGIKDILKESLKYFDEKAFDTATKGREGYLFPETYHVLPDEDGAGLVQMMSETFTKEIKTLQKKIAAFGRPLRDVIIMASILEEEARTMEVRRTIAGILWNRIRIGMPLQVDSTLTYTVGRNTFNLTQADLKSKDPYNTYTHKGLPPTPISNPGLEAIEAAITPISTPYLYFLTGRDGVMYYGRTFEEHIANRVHL